jgi:cell division septation protein DedD
MAIRRKASKLCLPDGYRATQAGEAWYLFDSSGNRISGPASAPAVEERAWDDVWSRLEHELHGELATLRDRSQPVHDLRRLRQYLRMVDAAARAESDAGRPEVATVFSWRSAGIGTAAAIVAFILGAMATGPGRDGVAPPPETSDTAAVAPAQPSPVFPSTGTSLLALPAMPQLSAAPRAAAARTRGYAVRVGTFQSSADAARMMHLVRSKGYIVDVVPGGTTSDVVTRAYRTRTQAERIARGLSAIGLPVQLTALRAL